MLLVPQWITTCLIVGVISRFSARHSKFSTLSPRIPQFKALFSKNEFHVFLYLESPLINESTNNTVCMFLFVFNLDICCWCVRVSVCVCGSVCVVCLYSSTVKASSECKMSERYLRGTDQRSCVVNIYLGASAKFVHLCIWKCHISPQRRNSSPPTNWRENDMIYFERTRKDDICRYRI